MICQGPPKPLLRKSETAGGRLFEFSVISIRLESFREYVTGTTSARRGQYTKNPRGLIILVMNIWCGFRADFWCCLHYIYRPFPEAPGRGPEGCLLGAAGQRPGCLTARPAKPTSCLAWRWLAAPRRAAAGCRTRAVWASCFVCWPGAAAWNFRGGATTLQTRARIPAARAGARPRPGDLMLSIDRGD